MAALAEEMEEYAKPVVAKLHLLVDRPIDLGTSFIGSAGQVIKWVFQKSTEANLDQNNAW